MEAIDVLVLRTVNEWRQSNYHVLLVTVLRTWGSSPRPVGAMMAIREDGRVVGSVSGAVSKMISSVFILNPVH